MNNYFTAFFLLFFCFIVESAANITGRVVDENGNGIYVQHIMINASVEGPSDQDGRFNINVDYIFSGVRKVEPSGIKKVSAGAEKIYSLSGTLVGEGGRKNGIGRGVYLVVKNGKAQKIINLSSNERNSFSSIGKSSVLAKANSVSLPTLSFVFPEYNCYENKGVEISGPNQSLGDIVFKFLRAGKISNLQKDDTSYFIRASINPGGAHPALFRSGIEIKWPYISSLDTFSVMRIFQSGSYQAFFPGFPCSRDTVSFLVDQPKIKDTLKFNPVDDPAGFGKVLRPSVIAGLKTNLWQIMSYPALGDTTDDLVAIDFQEKIFVKETCRLVGFLSAPFMDNSDTVEVKIDVSGNQVNPDYDYFNLGNPAGKEILVLAARDYANFLSFGNVSYNFSYYFTKGVFTDRAVERFANVNFVGSDGTRIPKDSVSLATANIHCVVEKTQAGFLPSLFNLKPNGKISSCQFHAHGSQNSVYFSGLASGPFSWTQIMSFSADTLAAIKAKLATDCIGYSSACSIAAPDTVEPKNGVAKVFANVFGIPLYASLTNTWLRYDIGKVVGAYEKVLPDK